MRAFFCTTLVALCQTLVVHAEPIHVLVWDEQQPKQAEAYENFLGNEIAARLDALKGDLEVRSVNLNDPEQGLSAENLDWADVMIWWGHARQWEISPETAQRKIIKRLKSGQLNMIFPTAVSQPIALMARQARSPLPNPITPSPKDCRRPFRYWERRCTTNRSMFRHPTK
jgi:hypothetical protein